MEEEGRDAADDGSEQKEIRLLAEPPFAATKADNEDEPSGEDTKDDTPAEDGAEAAGKLNAE